MPDMPLDRPWWPPADDEPLGLERAEEVIVMLILVGGPVVAEAEDDLRQRIGDQAEIVRNATTGGHLARHADPGSGDGVAVLGGRGPAGIGDATRTSIQLLRDGRLTWRRD